MKLYDWILPNRDLSKISFHWYSASGCPMASRNKSRGLDPTGTIPLSSVGTSTTNNPASSVVSATNNNNVSASKFAVSATVAAAAASVADIEGD